MIAELSLTWVPLLTTSLCRNISVPNCCAFIDGVHLQVSWGTFHAQNQHLSEQLDGWNVSSANNKPYLYLAETTGRCPNHIGEAVLESCFCFRATDAASDAQTLAAITDAGVNGQQRNNFYLADD